MRLPSSVDLTVCSDTYQRRLPWSALAPLKIWLLLIGVLRPAEISDAILTIPLALVIGVLCLRFQDDPNPANMA